MSSHVGMTCTYYSSDGKGPFAAICVGPATHSSNPNTIDLLVFHPGGPAKEAVPQGTHSSSEPHEHWEPVGGAGTTLASLFTTAHKTPTPTPNHKPPHKPKR